MSLTEENLISIVNMCLSFFRKYLPESQIVKTEEGYDIIYLSKEYGEIELGSYGIRSCPFLKWIYATAVAEPRLSSTIKMIKNGIS